MPSASEFAVQDPLKPWKSAFSPSLKLTFLASCLFAAFFLVYLSAFPGLQWPRSCPECDRAFMHRSYREFPNGDVVQEKTNISHILFGIGGSAKTWSRRRQYCELWWKPNVHRGFVWLDEEPEEGSSWPKTSPPYRVSADTTRFKYTCEYGSRSAVRIARIVKESFELGLKNVRWFVMGDDDTVFFTENLVTVLNKYDHNQMYYIGGNSESVEQDLEHSFSTAYGGAGFAISYPLAAELVRVLDGCIDRYADFYGSDQKIGGCMSEIGVPVTKEHGFHQIDIRGSPLGLLSVHPQAPLVSLHHLDYVQPLFPGMDRIDSVKRLIDAYKADPNRALQHSFCYDQTRNWSVSVAWGYNVQLYPYMVPGKNLSTPLQTFLTWGSWSQEPFMFDTRVMGLDTCQRPVIFYFSRVKKHGTRHTYTTYEKISTNSRMMCDRDDYGMANSIKGFNVSAAILDPQVWNKAPRRQCCEIINGSDQLNRIVQVRITGCNRSQP